MKNFYFTAKILLLSLAFFSLQAQAQAPQTITYQSVIRNSSNALLANTAVGIKISILQGSSTGTEAYAETQTATTNTNGLVSLQIGNGTPTTGTTFAGIDWAAGPYFIKTETDPTGGSNYTITGTQQMASVPYALYAAKSGGTVFEPTIDIPDAIHNTNQGNVGIGTDLPGEKLDVAGNLKVRGTVNNMNVGNLGSGSGNVVFGGAAFNTNASADDNTAIGNGAMQNTSTGNNNVAVGAYSLNVNTTGFWNNAIGYGSLGGNTTGYQNIGLGFGTLGTNTTGYQNTAIGNGSDVATGNLSNATAIGFGAIVDASNKIQLGNTDVISVNTSATYVGAGFVKVGGTSSQFLMADGSVSTGATGTQGPQGEPGPIGAMGEKGDMGMPGEPGPIGAMGEKGDRGDNGIDGLQGPEGPMGPVGETGPVGPAGSDALSVFETTLDQYGNNNISNTNSGNVGIGTNTPYAKLDVNGDLRVQNDAMFQGSTHFFGSAFMMGKLEIEGNDFGFSYNDKPSLTVGNNGGGMGGGKIIAFKHDGEEVASLNGSGVFTSNGYRTPTGTSSEYLMADGTTSAGTVATTMGSIGASSSVNGGTINSGELNLTPADATYGGVVTTGDQTFAGAKTFSSDIIINGINAGVGVGGDCVKFGAGALATNYGNTNSAFGTAAMQNNTSGFDNTAVGWNANSANTTGDGNTAIGVRSLEGNTVGSQLTAIGHVASVGSPNLVNATAIGYASIVDASNQIQLGNGSVTSVNTSGTYTGAGFKIPYGTDAQFLMADGSVSTGNITELQNQITVQQEQIMQLTNMIFELQIRVMELEAGN